MCQWQGCAEPAPHRAPMGRGREGQYFQFCVAHVQQYNKTYNYFDGMSDSEVEAYQKSAATGHRPTWTVGANSMAHGRETDPHHRRFSEGPGRPRRFRERPSCCSSTAGVENQGIPALPEQAIVRVGFSRRRMA